MDSTQIEDNPCEPLKEVANAASLALRWLDKGFRLEKVDDITQKLRISICETCPAKKFEKSERRCLECCCPMDFKTTLKYDPIKTGFNLKKTAVKCPLKYW